MTTYTIYAADCEHRPSGRRTTIYDFAPFWGEKKHIDAYTRRVEEVYADKGAVATIEVAPSARLTFGHGFGSGRINFPSGRSLKPSQALRIAAEQSA